MKIKAYILALSIIFVAPTVSAQAIGKAEDKVRWRQSAYMTMGWSMQRIKANLDGKYEQAQVVQAANVIAAIANSGMGALFTPDTKDAKGWHTTKAKPEIFTDTAGVGKVAKAYISEANAMAQIASSGDMAAVKAQFSKLGETCKACHNDYRVKDN